jgi:3-oxoacyl-[acyl-carrier protein] reductase
MISDAPVAVVTGGSGGIGSAICQGLAAAGFRVIVGFNKSASRAEQLAASLPNGGHCACAAPVTDSGALKVLAQAVSQRYGRCDVLVNGAGMTRFVAHANLADLDDALIDEILTTNVRGSFAAVRALLPLLSSSPLSGGGVVINISSIAARTAMGSNIMYCASKAALDNMTLSLARALAPHVRVLSVAPGLVDTEFVKSLDAGWHDQQVARTPLRKLATPEDVASAVLCAVRDLTFSTGAILAVDGGRPLN